MGEHAVGLEHIAVLAGARNALFFEHGVDRGPERVDRLVEADKLFLRVVGDEILHVHARVVQHDVAEPDAVGKRKALGMHRPARGGLGAGLGERGQLARGDHLGEYHRRGLQRLDLFLAIGAEGPVLHVEHAERLPARRIGTPRNE